MSEIEIVKWGVFHNVFGHDLYAYEVPSRLNHILVMLDRVPGQQAYDSVTLEVLGGHTESINGVSVVDVLAEKGFDYCGAHQGLYLTLTVCSPNKLFDLFGFSEKLLVDIGRYVYNEYEKHSSAKDWEIELSKGNLIYHRWTEKGYAPTRWAEYTPTAEATQVEETKTKFRVSLISPEGKVLVQTITAEHWMGSRRRGETMLRFFAAKAEDTLESLLLNEEIDEDRESDELSSEQRARLKHGRLITHLVVPTSWMYQVTKVVPQEESPK